MASRRLPKILRSGEFERLLDATRGGRDRLILESLYYLGLRVSEACKLRVQDLDLDDGTALIAHAKGDKDRYVPINGHLLGRLREWAGERRSGPLFASRLGRALSTRSVEYMVAQAGRDAAISRRIYPHMLRHSFASRLVDEDVNLVVIKDLLGHASVGTTQVYTQVSVKKLREAVERL